MGNMHIGAIDLDEDYVLEILQAMPAGLTRQQFHAKTRPDHNQGYMDEVAEAERRYFDV